MATPRSRFSAWPAVALALLLPEAVMAQQWQPTTAELLRKEKPGFGGLCGVTVQRKTGDVYINLSDRGVFRSTDQGKTWQRVGAQKIQGRTEWPGCMMFDPVGPGKTLLVALVYGSPVAVSPDAGATWRFMDNKSSHVDWCAVDWSSPEMKFVLALKHESGGLLLVSRDGGKSFGEVGKGYGPAWVFDDKTAVVAESPAKDRPKPGLLRTTDAGKSFVRSGDYRAAPLARRHALLGGSGRADRQHGSRAKLEKALGRQGWPLRTCLWEGRQAPVRPDGGGHRGEHGRRGQLVAADSLAARTGRPVCTRVARL